MLFTRHPRPQARRKRRFLRRWVVLAIGVIALATGLLDHLPAHAAGIALPPGQVGLAYANYNVTTNTATQAQPVFDVVNNGSTTIDLRKITIRYYFTEDGTEPLVFRCDYYPLFQTGGPACLNFLSATFLPLATPSATADHVFQVGFKTGSLAPGKETGPIQLAFFKNNYSLMNQTNDYSWNPTLTSFSSTQTSSTVVLYQQGDGTSTASDNPILLQGQPPANADPLGADITGTIDVKPSNIQFLSNSLGINTPVYAPLDAEPQTTTVNGVTTPSSAEMLQAAGTGILRFPGGGTADAYSWSTNTVGSLTGKSFSTPPKSIPADAFALLNNVPFAGDPSKTPPVEPSQPNAALFQSFADQANNFDAFMKFVQKSSTIVDALPLGPAVHGVQAEIVVNYGSSTAEDAANWVRYANMGGSNYTGVVPGYIGGAKGSATGHTYGIKYWSIGNEVYGDGTYTNEFEWVDPSKGKGPAAYAQGVIQYALAMKKVDPSIKIGVVLTMPGNNPDDDADNRRAGTDPWDQTVLNAHDTLGNTVCGEMDFADVHLYAQQPKVGGPGEESDQGLLNTPQNGNLSNTIGGTRTSVPAMLNILRTRLRNACGVVKGNAIQIRVTEANSVAYNEGMQTVNMTNALFAADDVMTLLENGAANVDWWDLYNAPHNHNQLKFSTDGVNIQGAPNINNPNLYGFKVPGGITDYGDYGILSSAQDTNVADCNVLDKEVAPCPPDVQSPPLNKPFPTWGGLAILKHLRLDNLFVAEQTDPATNPPTIQPASSSDASMVSIHATEFGPQLAVMFINKDQTNDHTVTINLQNQATNLKTALNIWNFTPADVATGGGFPNQTAGVVTASVSGTTVKAIVPAYSIIVVSIQLTPCKADAFGACLPIV